MKRGITAIFPEILNIDAPQFDSKGFWPSGNENLMTLLEDVVELSEGYWIDTEVLEDCYFYAFRTKDDLQSVWVTEGSEKFPRELKSRFPHNKAPPLNHWKDGQMSIRTFTVWPKSRFGEPMYLNVKERWYSERRLAFEQSSQPSASVNADKPRRLS